MSQFVPVVTPLSRAQIECHAMLIIQELSPGLIGKPGRFPVLNLFDS
jgi:hypothetical protein